MSCTAITLSALALIDDRSDLVEPFEGNINKGVPNHECGLPLYEHAIIRYIHSGLFVELRRKIKKLTMVSDMDQGSKALFKSTAQIRQEEQKHLDKFYNMIHPFSKARFCWEMTMIFVYLAQLILIPIEISTTNSLTAIVYPNLVLDLVSVLDLGLFFRTGYHDKKQQKVILEPKKVAIRYLKSYFTIDLMSSMPISFVLHAREEWSHFWPLKLLMISKLGRIPKLFAYLEKFCEHRNIWSYNLKVLNFTICLLILMIWATSIENLLKETDGKQRFGSTTYPEYMLESCFLTTMRFMQVGLVRSANNNLERITQAICLYFGSILNMIILAQIIQIYNRRSNARYKYNNLIQQISEYMKYKELPYRLREKVFRYVNFKFQKHVFKESDVFNTLSSKLREEISLHNCQKLVETVDFFKDAPAGLILRLVTKMKSEIYLPNDIIVQAGIPGNAMYFIYLGTVAVYAHNGKEPTPKPNFVDHMVQFTIIPPDNLGYISIIIVEEEVLVNLTILRYSNMKEAPADNSILTRALKQICHLHDGSHFGEIALVINEQRVASVIAIKDCEVFRLSRKDYQEAISPFPDFANKIRRNALGRLKMTNRLDGHAEYIELEDDGSNPSNI